MLTAGMSQRKLTLRSLRLGRFRHVRGPNKDKEKVPQAVNQRYVDSATTVLVIGQRIACPVRLKIIGTKLLCTIMATLDSSRSAIDHNVHLRCPLFKGMLVGRQTCRTLLRTYSRCFPRRTQCHCTNHLVLMPLSIPRKRSSHRQVILGASFSRDNCGRELCLARMKTSIVF